ncbi:hypothetical protein [Bacteriovorax sp. DB6_IX]|uniref:hypothetical protein n=1 Tax=Bacteriovorax sp. DB6_IX TaxID=1353530 RepID=UPI000389E8B6|nr:hypothetical protein [Bacteriovorax sp. DB6_IX]EQC50944.1 hypothetical protein M901_1172 [Bacteriovorax sp. DB6_IX]
MILAIGKTVLAAVLISFVSWLSGKKTALAGFITALPLTTLLALAFSHMEWGDSKQSVAYAKSVFVAIPVSLLFFVPFLLAEKFNLNFWSCYVSGIVLLGVGYFVHDFVTKLL